MSDKTKVIAVVSLVILLTGLFGSCSNRNPQKDSPNTKSEQQKQTATTLQGTGDQVKTVFLKRGLAMFSIYYNGSRHFAVWLKGSEGEKLELLANETDAYTGQKSVQIRKDGQYLIEVSANDKGKWGIDIY